MMKKFGKFLLCATMIIALAACGDGGAKESGQNAEESQSVESTTESGSTAAQESGALGGEESKPQFTAMELYEKFLAGGEKVKKGKTDFQVYGYDGKGTSFFVPYVDDEGYTLKGLVGRAQEFDNVQDAAVFTSDVEYCYMDLGNDGEKELLLRVYHSGGAWNEAHDYQFLINKGEDGLQLLYMMVSNYASNDYFLNDNGLVVTYNWDGENPEAYGYLDAQGEYHLLYTQMEYTAMGVDYGIEYGVPAAAKKISDELGESYYFDGINYAIYQIGEDQEKAETVYGYINYGYLDDPDLSRQQEQMAEKAFANAGVACCTEDEFQKKLSDYAQKVNAPENILSRQEEGVMGEWLAREEFWPGSVSTVSDVDGLMSAIKDNSMILLQPGKYNLTKWLAANTDKVSAYYYDEDFGGNKTPGIVYTGGDEADYGIVLAGIHNLIIGSADPKNPAEIVCTAPYALVLDFENCTNVSLEDLIMGHDIEVGECAGDVLGFDRCSHLKLNGCDLYGCGVYGAGLYSCYNIELDDCKIHDCTYGCLYVSGCDWVTVNQTDFRDCADGTMFCVYNSMLQFNDCSFKNLGGDMLELYNGTGYVYFYECQFDAAALSSIKETEGYDNYVTIY